MTSSWAPNEESRTVNILLLGETGVGKSTWINGFVNYLTYESLEEAERGGEVSVIPSQFTVTDSNFNEFTITYGEDTETDKIAQSSGQSATQIPKSYFFDIENVKIRIIDTPGVGDSRGIEKDRENMQNIMAHLSQYGKINGIIILLKPNTARLSVLFSFCIKELLKHLHKDACKNILICFTNGRSTFYKPGDTMRALKELLDSNKQIDIKLNKDTVFCMDNEPVRFLMAKKIVEFEEDEREEYANSWRKAVNESMRLVCRVSSLEPHSIQKTLFINEMRRSINNLSRPVALIANLIITNTALIKDKQAEEIAVDSSIEEHLKTLKVPTVHLKKIKIGHPNTVCTATKCVDLISVGKTGIHQIHYKTICHDQCSIDSDLNTIRCAPLQQCWAMQLSIHKCRICSCGWEDHMHITYDATLESAEEDNPAVRKMIDANEEKKKIIEAHQKALVEKLEQLEREKKKLAEVSAQLACYLKHNAIAAYNDSLLDYLDHLIEMEKEKSKMKVEIEKGNEGNSSKTLDGLMKLRSEYQEQKQIFEEVLKTNTDVNESLDMDKINKMISELKELPTIGKELEGFMEQIKKNDPKTKLNEDKIKFPSKSKNVLKLKEKIKNTNK